MSREKLWKVLDEVWSEGQFRYCMWMERVKVGGVESELFGGAQRSETGLYLIPVAF